MSTIIMTSRAGPVRASFRISVHHGCSTYLRGGQILRPYMAALSNHNTLSLKLHQTRSYSSPSSISWYLLPVYWKCVQCRRYTSTAAVSKKAKKSLSPPTTDTKGSEEEESSKISRMPRKAEGAGTATPDVTPTAPRAASNTAKRKGCSSMEQPDMPKSVKKSSKLAAETLAVGVAEATTATATSSSTTPSLEQPTTSQPTSSSKAFAAIHLDESPETPVRVLSPDLSSVPATAAARAQMEEAEKAAYIEYIRKRQEEQRTRGKGLPPPPGRVVTWRTALAASTACIAITCMVILQTEKKRREKAAITESTAVGTPLLGGPWTLIDGTGRLRSSQEFVDADKYQLIYFGFTFCPDICPQEIEKMAQVIEIIDKEFGEIIQPIFITVDPGRDTVAQIEHYCKEFHPRLLGLTGTPEQIKDVTRKFRVYYNETVRVGDEDYLVDHSIIQYLIGRNGKFADFYGKNLTVREMADKIVERVRRDMAKEEGKKKDYTKKSN